MKRNRVYLIIDNGMIWEAFVDKDITLLIKNNDKQWLRKLDVMVNHSEIDEIEELINDIDSECIELPGLSEEKKKHMVVVKTKKR